MRLAVPDVGAQRVRERVRRRVRLRRDAAADDGVLADLIGRERQPTRPPVQDGLRVRRVVSAGVVLRVRKHVVLAFFFFPVF